MLMLEIAYGKANVQTVIQLTGGTLTKAMAMHLAAVLLTDWALDCRRSV